MIPFIHRIDEIVACATAQIVSDVQPPKVCEVTRNGFVLLLLFPFLGFLRGEAALVCAVCWQMLGEFLSWLGGETGAEGLAPQVPKIWGVPEDVGEHINARGVRYNMKVVIRGARKVGKTSLLNRLQGAPPPTAYVPSTAIAAATVRWMPRGSRNPEQDETVRVEAWDVVDQGTSTSLACSIDPSALVGIPKHLPQMPTDATTVDVYRNAHCVIMMFDVTRRETFNYVRTAILSVPPDMLIIIIANFVDQVTHRVVSDDEVEALCRSCRRTSTPLMTSLLCARVDPSVSFEPQWICASMTTGFGMRPLHSYLHVPFTFMKLVEHEAKLKAFYEQVSLYNSELAEIREHQNYEEYMTLVNKTSASSDRTDDATEPVKPTHGSASGHSHRRRPRVKEQFTETDETSDPLDSHVSVGTEKSEQTHKPGTRRASTVSVAVGDSEELAAVIARVEGPDFATIHSFLEAPNAPSAAPAEATMAPNPADSNDGKRPILVPLTRPRGPKPAEAVRPESLEAVRAFARELEVSLSTKNDAPPAAAKE